MQVDTLQTVYVYLVYFVYVVTMYTTGIVVYLVIIYHRVLYNVVYFLQYGLVRGQVSIGQGWVKAWLGMGLADSAYPRPQALQPEVLAIFRLLAWDLKGQGQAWIRQGIGLIMKNIATS